jgi:1-acyl-sn-glycerol-3-phosphate acyltransferase
LATGAPIVPVCITGNQCVPPIGSSILHPAVIRIRRLPAVTYEEYRNFNAFKLKNYLRQIIAKEVQVMEQSE